MEMKITGEINLNEVMNALTEMVVKDEYIDNGVIENWVTDWLNDNLQSQLGDSFNIEEVIEEFMCNADLSDYIDVSDYIDTDDIRYNIEDEILEQVNDHLDYDSIKYNIEDEIIEGASDYVWSNFDITDHVDWNDIKNNCEIYELEEKVEALEGIIEELMNNPPRKVGLIRRILGWMW